MPVVAEEYRQRMVLVLYCAAADLCEEQREGFVRYIPKDAYTCIQDTEVAHHIMRYTTEFSSSYYAVTNCWWHDSVVC